jgi:hypothetical protein
VPHPSQRLYDRPIVLSSLVCLRSCSASNTGPTHRECVVLMFDLRWRIVDRGSRVAPTVPSNGAARSNVEPFVERNGHATRGLVAHGERFDV